MAVQSSFYSGTALDSRTFPSTKHIPTKQHMAVWRKQILDSIWVQMSIGDYQLINNACVLNSLLNQTLYSDLEVRVADEPDELADTPSDIALVAGIADEIVIVAGIADDVETTAANDANITIVAGIVDEITDVASEPLRQSILDAEDNANMASTKATEASNSATDSQLKAWESEDSAFHWKEKAEAIVSDGALLIDNNLDDLDNVPTALTNLGLENVNNTSDADKPAQDVLLGSIGNLATPLLDLPLQSNLSMVKGTGSVSFERDTGATYIDRYGVLKYAGVDEARFEEDGLLIEGGSTNLYPYSDFSTGWVINDSTLDASAELSPDGVTTTHRWYGGTGNHYLVDSITLGMVDCTISCYIKSNGAGKDTFRLLGANSVISSDFTATIEWVRYDFAFTGNGSGSHGLSRDSSDNEVDLLVCFVQLEELPFASSYIPTTDSAVTRGADVCSVVLNDNIGNINSVDGVGAITLDIDFLSTSKAAFIFKMYTSSSDRVQLFNNGTTIDFYTNSDGTGFASSFNTISSSVTCVIDSTSNSIYKNGAIQDSDNRGGRSAIATIPNSIYIGSSETGTVQLFGHIKNFKIHDIDLSSTEVALNG